MSTFTCKDCNREFDSYKGYQNHNARIHKVSGAQTYVNVYLNGEWPKCKCGCGQELNFQLSKFGEYIRGHIVRVTGGFYSEKGAEKSASTRRQQYATGVRKQWNKGKKYTQEQYDAILKGLRSPERSEKISKALKGKPKSEAHREIMRATLARNRKEILKGNPSKLEYTFAEILIGLGIEFVHQYEVDGFDYDFYIPGKNMLIEIDGDYWHGNPNIYTELNNMQRKNRGLDKLKNQHAADRQYVLVRFWEHDIRENRIQVVQKLIESTV